LQFNCNIITTPFYFNTVIYSGDDKTEFSASSSSVSHDSSEIILICLFGAFIIITSDENGCAA